MVVEDSEHIMNSSKICISEGILGTHCRLGGVHGLLCGTSRAFPDISLVVLIKGGAKGVQGSDEVECLHKIQEQDLSNLSAHDSEDQLTDCSRAPDHQQYNTLIIYRTLSLSAVR